MAENNTQLPCPFCGHEAPHTAQANVDLLRATMMSQIVPALVHDIRRPLEMLHRHRRLIERELGANASKRLRELLERDERALHRVYEFLRNVQALYHGGERDAVVPLEEMPEHLQWFCELCEFPGPVDFTPLRRTRGQVSFGLYWDAFCFAMQGALLAIRRDRAPNARMGFDVRQGDLITTLDLTHESLPEQKPMAWRALEWLIRSAGGTVSIETEESQTTVRWGLPIRS